MPYDRPAAPGDLAPIEEFCNSARFLHDEDAFTDVASTREWLRAHDWPAEEIDEPARLDLVRAREAIRSHVAGEGSDVLNEYARRLLLPPQWHDGQPVIPVAAAQAAENVIGRLLATLVLEELSGRAGRFKVCQAPDCRWLYYDRSPGNNSVWCSMNICGARHKMRTYRSRRTTLAHKRQP